MNKIIKGILGAGIGLAFAAGSVFAGPPVLFGGATIVSGGNPGNAAQLVSDTAIVFSGVNFILPTDTAWSDLDTLSADFNVTDDNCGGGSPRFQIRVDTNNDGVADGTVHVAIGPSPSFTGCTSGWQNTGNLIGNEDAGRYDFSAFGGSTFTTYSNAPASVMNGEVISIQVVVDGGWNAAATGGDGEQTVLVDNVLINSDMHTFDPNVPTNKDQCKNGGWEDLEDADGNAFRNQGQCVSYFNHL